MTEITLNGQSVAPCRRCGATGRDPEKPTTPCKQCQGQKFVGTDKQNKPGPGVKRLVQAARAQAPKQAPQGPAMMILWEKVKSREAVMLVESLKATQPQRDRKQRRAYNAHCRQAVRMGILVPVPKEGEENLRESGQLR